MRLRLLKVKPAANETASLPSPADSPATVGPGAVGAKQGHADLAETSGDHLLEIRREIAAMRAMLEQLGRPRSPAPRAEDVTVLEVLLPAIAEATRYGRVTFTVKELFSHARLDPALRQALDAAGSDGLKVGRLLRRASGVKVGQFQLHANGRSRDGQLYTLRM